jgi:hypothetical protein
MIRNAKPRLNKLVNNLIIKLVALGVTEVYQLISHVLSDLEF